MQPLHHTDSLQQHESNKPYEDAQEKWLKEASISPDDLAKIVDLSNSNDPDGQEAFSETLEDVAFSLAEYLHGEEIRGNISIIRDPSAPKEAQRQARDAQLKLLQKCEQQILELAGLDISKNKSDTAIAKEAIEKKLVDAQREDGDAFDPLRTLGILQQNNQGEMVFVYPRNIFPKSTNDKWDKYVIAVSQHMDIASRFGKGLSTKEDIVEADRSRRIMHNAISRDVQNILGLSGKEWDFEESRKLVAKMRENRFPNMLTGEAARTARATIAGIVGMTVVKDMRRRLLPGYDSLRYPDEPQ